MPAFQVLTKDFSQTKDATSPTAEEEPRVFELKRPRPQRHPLFPKAETSVLTNNHSTFYQQRINKKRQAEIAKRNRERIQDPSFFPSVPKNLP